MYPSLTQNQKVIGMHWLKKLQINDLIVLEIKNKLMIKRIKKINNNELWIEGDNKNESTDSRSFGWIKKSQVVAKVMVRL